MNELFSTQSLVLLWMDQLAIHCDLEISRGPRIFHLLHIHTWSQIQMPQKTNASGHKRTLHPSLPHIRAAAKCHKLILFDCVWMYTDVYSLFHVSIFVCFFVIVSRLEGLQETIPGSYPQSPWHVCHSLIHHTWAFSVTCPACSIFRPTIGPTSEQSNRQTRFFKPATGLKIDIATDFGDITNFNLLLQLFFERRRSVVTRWKFFRTNWRLQGLDQIRHQHPECKIASMTTIHKSRAVLVILITTYINDSKRLRKSYQISRHFVMHPSFF